MSTKISDLSSASYGPHRLERDFGDEVFFTVAAAGRAPTSARMARTDFLSAVEKECNVIIVPRETLQEVTEVSGCLTVGAGALTVGAATTVADADAAIGEWVAIREYRMAHPPFDMEQYADLVTLIADSSTDALTGSDIDILARRLYAAGVRIEDGAK